MVPGSVRPTAGPDPRAWGYSLYNSPGGIDLCFLIRLSSWPRDCGVVGCHAHGFAWAWYAGHMATQSRGHGTPNKRLFDTHAVARRVPVPREHVAAVRGETQRLDLGVQLAHRQRFAGLGVPEADRAVVAARGDQTA